MYDGFIDHGIWERYLPDTIPAGIPSNAMFARRTSDGHDWYDYLYPGTDFQPTSVKFTVAIVQPTDTTSGYTIINASAVDTSMLFPSDNTRIIEMPGDYSSYTPRQLNDQFAGKMVDLESGEITNPPTSSTLLYGQMTVNTLARRIEALERKNGLHTGN